MAFIVRFVNFLPYYNGQYTGTRQEYSVTRCKVKCYIFSTVAALAAYPFFKCAHIFLCNYNIFINRGCYFQF